MKKISSYHGTLWEIELNENLGFGYIQIIDTKIYNGWGFLVKIMNYRSEVRKKYISIEEFNAWDMLTSPLMAAGTIPQKGNKIWKKIGTFPLNNTDTQIPVCKEGGWDYEEEKEVWFIIKNLTPQDWEGGYSYEQIKHLGYYNPVFFLHSIHHRITMEWMKVLGMDFEAYTTSESDEEHIKTMKRQVKYSVPYSEVPIEIRGKVKL